MLLQHSALLSRHSCFCVCTQQAAQLKRLALPRSSKCHLLQQHSGRAAWWGRFPSRARQSLSSNKPRLSGAGSENKTSGCSAQPAVRPLQQCSFAAKQCSFAAKLMQLKPYQLCTAACACVAEQICRGCRSHVSDPHSGRSECSMPVWSCQCCGQRLWPCSTAACASRSATRLWRCLKHCQLCMAARASTKSHAAPECTVQVQ